MHDRHSPTGKKALSKRSERVLRIGSMDNADPDVHFWLDKSDRERLHALFNSAGRPDLDELPSSDDLRAFLRSLTGRELSASLRDTR